MGTNSSRGGSNSSLPSNSRRRSELQIIVNPYTNIRPNSAMQTTKSSPNSGREEIPGSVTESGHNASEHTDAKVKTKKHKGSSKRGTHNVYRTDILDVLKHISFFTTLSEDDLNILAKCFTTKVYNAGDMIIKEGATSRDFYIVYSGTVDIVSQKPESDSMDAYSTCSTQSGEGHCAEEVVASEGAGAYFGEVALLEGTPRTASVRSREDGTVTLVLTYETYREERLAKYFRSLRRLLTRNSKSEVAEKLKSVPFFSTLEEDKISVLTELFRLEMFERGSVICREGEPGDGMYIIMSGSVQVVSRVNQDDAEQTRTASKSAAGKGGKRKRKGPTYAKGVVLKRGDHFKTWKRRYCVLEGTTLKYYECENYEEIPHSVQPRVVDNRTLSIFCQTTDGEREENNALASGSIGQNVQQPEFSVPARESSQSSSNHDEESSMDAGASSMSREPSNDSQEDNEEVSTTSIISLSKAQRREQCMNLIGNLRPVGRRVLKGEFEVVGVGIWREEYYGFAIQTENGRFVAFRTPSSQERDEWTKALVAAVRIQRYNSSSGCPKIKGGSATSINDEVADDSSQKLSASQHQLERSVSMRLLEHSDECSKPEAQSGLRWWRLSKIPLLGRFTSGTLTGEKENRGEIGYEGDSEDDEQKSFLVRDLKAGSYFGEIALITDQPRSATVVAKERTGLLKLSEKNFQSFIQLVPHLRQDIDNMVIQRSAANLRALNVPFLSGFTEKKLEKLAEMGHLVRLRNDDIVFREGDMGNTFYIVLQGSVEVRQKGEAGDNQSDDSDNEGSEYGKRINIVKAGSYFVSSA
eukprot:gb/GECG01004871.1/.p1 GENE.gb/GECG01004871.1/~~gb/GECG01004871.1/.p1  ORF type:complete len:810 (+),score=107.93 gb/GECG01004871.1/:1-2430(+)